MLKRFARLAAHRSGAFRLVQRLNDSQVRILMYHRFPQADAANFDRQCAFLANNYDVIPLAEAIERMEQGRSLRNLAVITIDDGYADMHDIAFPILQRYRLPATLFVTSGFIDRRCWMPGDHVRFFFANAGQDELTVTDEHGVQHQFRGDDGRAGDRLRALLKRVSNRTREAVLSELTAKEAEKGVRYIPREYEPCTWEQLREMAHNGVSLGAHTVTHPILSRVEERAATEQEIVESKASIEQHTGMPVETFAYPNGLPEDISGVSVECVRRNFRGAVTAIFGMNVPATDPHQLLRLPCDPDLPVASLARMLAGPLRRSAVPTAQLRPAY